jgi:hypothetical protein
LAERDVVRDTAPLQEVYDFLRPIQLRETDRLSDLVGRRFDEWTTLRGGM